jgi:hypothetical protein
MNSVEVLDSAQNYLFDLLFVLFFGSLTQQVLSKIAGAVLTIE